MFWRLRSAQLSDMHLPTLQSSNHRLIVYDGSVMSEHMSTRLTQPATWTMPLPLIAALST